MIHAVHTHNTVADPFYKAYFFYFCLKFKIFRLAFEQRYNSVYALTFARVQIFYLLLILLESAGTAPVVFIVADGDYKSGNKTLVFYHNKVYFGIIFFGKKS